MLRRELPLGCEQGRLIRVADGRIAIGPDGSPLQPEQPWTQSVQPLAFWHDEPIALVVEEHADESWPDGRQWLARLPESWFPLISTALQVAAWIRDHRFCGRCGAPSARLDAEFAMHCAQCGQKIKQKKKEQRKRKKKN